jgi:hypothetical protein
MRTYAIMHFVLELLTHCCFYGLTGKLDIVSG